MMNKNDEMNGNHKKKPAQGELDLTDDKYRALFETMTQGVIFQDAQGKITSVNPAAERILGLTLEKMQGRTSTYPGWRAIHEDGTDFPGEEHPSMVALRTGKEVRDVVMGVFNPETKEYCWINVHAIPQFRHGEDKPYQVYSTFENITERKKTEEEKDGLLKAIDSSKEGIAISDENDRYIYVNAAHATIYGYVKEELIGKTWMEITPLDIISQCGEILSSTLHNRDKGTFSADIQGLRKDGTTIPTEVKGTALWDANGKYKGHVCIVSDISERKKVEDTLKLLSGALEEAPDGVQIIDLNGNVTYSNRAVEEMFGIPVEELKGKHVNEMNVDPDFAVKTILPSIKETGSWVGELMVKHKSGHEFPIWLNTSIVNDREGKPMAMVGMIRDMTERRQFEKALKDSEEQYRSLFEDSPISLWEEDCSLVKKYIDSLRNKGVEDFRTFFESHPEEVENCAKMVKVVNVNKATLSIFRARSKEELLKGLSKIFSEHSYDMFREELVAIAEGSTEFEGEDFVRTMAGDVLQIYLKWSVAPGHEETYSRRHVSIVDITERKRTEEAMKKYARKLEDSNRMKELFIDIMHHDLMNPLATASGFTELLKEEDPCNMMYIETVQKNLVKAIDLIDLAINFSRIDSLERIDFTNMDLKEVIDGVVDNLNPMAAKAGMKIENMIQGSMPVKANKIIEEVFANLISNAIKYAQNGKRIIIKSEDRDPFWNVIIIDFGEGLKKTDKTIIFDRFCRLEKKGVKGSGLGLAIVKKIVELHRGGIGVEDNPQGGAVFIVEIPKSKYLDQIY